MFNPQQQLIPTQKEGNRLHRKGEFSMRTYHYFQTVVGFDQPNTFVRIITNALPERHAVSYNASVAKGYVPVDNIMAIDSGPDHRFWLLEDATCEFTFTSRPISSLTTSAGFINQGLLDEGFRRVNFSWSDSSSWNTISFREMVPDENGDMVNRWEGKWTLRPIGLKVTKNHPKISKRMKEVTRLVRYHYAGDINAVPFPTPAISNDRALDGTNVMTRELATKMGIPAHIHRINVRLLDVEQGLIKGDAQIIDDFIDNDEIREFNEGLPEPMKLPLVDFIYHTDNLKDELQVMKTVHNFSRITALPHEPKRPVLLDEQTLSNFSMIFDDDYIRRQLDLIEDRYTKAIAEGGDLYPYLVHNPRNFSEKFTADYIPNYQSFSLNDQFDFLRAAGLPPATFSNLIFTRVGALVNQMKSGQVYRDSDGDPLKGTALYNRLFIPASRAFEGAVLSTDAYEHMMEREPESFDCLTFDENHGLIFPADRFHDTFDLHGGWDSDDTACVFAVELTNFNADNYHQLVDDNVIAPNVVPGEICALVIRRPNGIGEYSIEAIGGDMPWYHVDDADPIKIDIATLPPSITRYQSQIHVPSAAVTPRDSKTYTRRVAREAAIAQTTNPHVGRYANPMIVWSYVFSFHNPPAELVARMEDAVDGLEQTADPAFFAQMERGIKQLWVQLLAQMIEHNTPVDRVLVKTRIPKEIRINGEVLEIHEILEENNLIEDGRLTNLQADYTALVGRLSELGKQTANLARREMPLFDQIRQMTFGPKTLAFVQNFNTQATAALSKVDKEYRGLINKRNLDPLVKRQYQAARTAATAQVVDHYTKSFISECRKNRAKDPNSFGDEYNTILAYYKFLTVALPNSVNGLPDRVLAQPGSANAEHWMSSLFVDACRREGFIG